MGSCFYDFIITQNGSLYIMYFGGWEDEILMSVDNGKLWMDSFANCIYYLIYLKNSRVIHNGE